MTIHHIVYSFNRYGIKGLRDWLLRLLGVKDPLLRAFQSHTRKDIMPTHGITIIGNISGHFSLSKTMRDFAQSLKEANIPYQTVDTTKALPSDLVINKYTDIIGMFFCPKISGLNKCRRHRIVFWEFDTGFLQCYPDAIDGDPIIVFSQYCRQTLQRQIHSNNPIREIRYPFHFEAKTITPSPEIRSKFGIPETSFMVFFNFDYRSSYYRKNPEGLLTSFLTAFSRTENVTLAFKTIGSQKKRDLSEKLKDLVNRNGASHQVIFIDDYIPDDDLVSLTASCDVYASLHRGEGFGLGIAEAMSMGKAVIVSDCGATNEFCHPDTAEIISHKIVPVQPEQIDQPLYKWVGTWPEPDIREASIALRKLYENQAYRIELGQRAQAFIREYFSLENFKKSMAEFFESQRT